MLPQGEEVGITVNLPEGCAWTVTVPTVAQEWLSASPAAGTGTATFKLKASSNDSGIFRKAPVAVAGSKGRKIIAATQKTPVGVFAGIYKGNIVKDGQVAGKITAAANPGGVLTIAANAFGKSVKFVARLDATGHFDTVYSGNHVWGSISGGSLTGTADTEHYGTLTLTAAGSPPPPANVTVTLTPQIAPVTAGATQQFNATVTGSANTQVTWRVQESTGGTISAGGLYTAPAIAGTYHVLATSVANPIWRATATVTVTAAAGITITPQTASVAAGGTQQFTATVTGTSNTAVTWNIQEGTAGGAITSTGGYTAPSEAGTYHVKATSVADSSKSATATVTVTASSGGVPTGIQMGGSIQGNALALAGTLTSLAGVLNQNGVVDGTGSDARLLTPNFMTTDGRFIYFPDTTYQVIRKLEISTGTVTTIAGTYGQLGTVDGTGATARFNTPFGITTDGTNLYVTEKSSNAIRKIVISTGAVTTLAHTQLYPLGITTDGTNLYVAHLFAISKVVIATGAVSMLVDIDLNALGRNFYGITTDGTSLFVTDLNSVIYRIPISTGVVSALAGSFGLTGTADGTGDAARFNYPYGITTDGTNLYVADHGNKSVRQIVISSGAVTTVNGTSNTIPMDVTTDGTSCFIGAGSRILKLQ